MFPPKFFTPPWDWGGEEEEEVLIALIWCQGSISKALGDACTVQSEGIISSFAAGQQTLSNKLQILDQSTLWYSKQPPSPCRLLKYLIRNNYIPRKVIFRCLTFSTSELSFPNGASHTGCIPMKRAGTRITRKPGHRVYHTLNDESRVRSFEQKT